LSAIAAASPDTQAILLLTAPLSIGGRAGMSREAKPLSPAEYRSVALALKKAGLRPGELLEPGAQDRLRGFVPEVDDSRLIALLRRGFRLAQALDRWQNRSMWVISRADPQYPDRLKRRLRELSPPVLYGCGDVSLLAAGGLAVVGSRSASAQALDLVDGVSRLAAAASVAIISGGAKGVDRAAMCGTIARSGRAVGVMADQLERAVLDRAYSDAISEGRLLLISPYDPAAPFVVGHAMDRNKLVYALSDAALVACADHKKGGTWAGAEEQLRRFRLVPVYVSRSCASSKVADSLTEMGAMDWPSPESMQALQEIVSATHPQVAVAPAASSLFTGSAEEPPPSIGAVVPTVESGPAEEIFAAATRSIMRLLDEPKSAAALAKGLRVTTPQATAWLKELVSHGSVTVSGGRTKKYERASGGLFTG
jgi:DNA processing protein